MSDDTSNTRICRACGKDCTGQPRIKDKKGRYLHKACFEKARAKAKAKQAAEAAALAAQDDGMFDLNSDDNGGMFDDLQTPDANSMPCSSCGNLVSEGTVICTTCGHNLATGGHASKMKAPKDKTAGAGAAVTSASWLLALIGAAVGGGVAVVGWIIVVSMTQMEYFVVALLLGFLPGFGAALLAGKHKGTVTGLIAAAVTLVAIPSAKFGAMSFITQSAVDEYTEELTGTFDETWMPDNEAKELLAYRASLRAERNGAALDWPEGMDIDSAFGFLDYPASITGPIRDNWNALDSAAKEALKDEIMAESQMGRLADRWAFDQMEDGTELAWPEGMTYEDSMLIEDYPPDLVASAKQFWDDKSRQEQIDYVTEELNRFTHQFTSADGTIAAMTSDYDLMDLGWDALITFGAMILAFGTGAGISTDDEAA
jgi:hypothetical protein